jgi:hypothetical protein
MFDPVVVAGPPTYNGGDASTIRVKDVSGAGFSVRIQEFEYQKHKAHTTESLNWLAVESGNWRVNEGTKFSAGRATVEAGTVTHVGYSTFFASSPAAVLASVSSANDEAKALVTRVE